MHVVAGGIVGSVADQCNKANMALRHVRNFFFFFVEQRFNEPRPEPSVGSLLLPFLLLLLLLFHLGFLTLPEALLCGSEPGFASFSESLELLLESEALPLSWPWPW